MDRPRGVARGSIGGWTAAVGVQVRALGPVEKTWAVRRDGRVSKDTAHRGCWVWEENRVEGLIGGEGGVDGDVVCGRSGGKDRLGDVGGGRAGRREGEPTHGDWRESRLLVAGCAA
jgi:hypothetical protein